MPFEEAVEAAACWGDVRVMGPVEHNPTVQIQAGGDDFDVIVVLKDQQTVNAVDISAPSEAGPQVLWRGIDVFKTPARQLLKVFSDAGYVIEDSDPEAPVVLDLTIAFNRWTSQEVPLDPYDGLPLYFTAALVSDENPSV
ncbi:hypothetical protein [Streptomyces koelreuteriae]|uniref:hypothetical protein n=1 Tax=Streptomyces koelreuteriae TaxID=2838015 RepID=UPI003EBBC5E5